MAFAIKINLRANATVQINNQKLIMLYFLKFNGISLHNLHQANSHSCEQFKHCYAICNSHIKHGNCTSERTSISST